MKISEIVESLRSKNQNSYSVYDLTALVSDSQALINYREKIQAQISTLKGTEKQVTWANKIRQTWIENITHAIICLQVGKNFYHEEDYYIKEIERTLKLLLAGIKDVSASSWINTSRKYIV